MKKKTSETKNKKKDNAAGLFVPAGVLTGMGFGFLFDQLVAGLFIGLGVGFLIFAIISTMLQKQ
jgi:hypothetical protein